MSHHAHRPHLSFPFLSFPFPALRCPCCPLTTSVRHAGVEASQRLRGIVYCLLKSFKLGTSHHLWVYPKPTSVQSLKPPQSRPRTTPRLCRPQTTPPYPMSDPPSHPTTPGIYPSQPHCGAQTTNPPQTPHSQYAPPQYLPSPS